MRYATLSHAVIILPDVVFQCTKILLRIFVSKFLRDADLQFCTPVVSFSEFGIWGMPVLQVTDDVFG